MYGCCMNLFKWLDIESARTRNMRMLLYPASQLSSPIRNLHHDEGATEVGVSFSVPDHAERKSADSVCTLEQKRLQAQWRPHHDEGSYSFLHVCI